MLKYLNDIKEKLVTVDKTLNEQSEVKTKDQRENKLDNLLKDLLDTSPDNAIVYINVGGTKFATRKKTLLNVEDNLFYKIIKSNKLDITQEIFIDRSPALFPYIIDYLRYKKMNFNGISSDKYQDLKEEIIYYELLDLEKLFEEKKGVEFVKVDVNAYYYEGYTMVGCNDVNVLNSTDLNTGICTTSPGWMILELSEPILINRIQIGGYTGSSDWVYSTGYGAGGNISTSIDKIKWENVGTIPNDFGIQIKETALRETIAKYIRLESNGWLGIGHVKAYKF